jgi:hypothetical protein
MAARIRTTDEHASTVFFWDKTKRIISKAFEDRIWFWELGEDFDFRCIGSEPKPKGAEKVKRKT